MRKVADDIKRLDRREYGHEIRRYPLRQHRQSFRVDPQAAYVWYGAQRLDDVSQSIVAKDEGIATGQDDFLYGRGSRKKRQPFFDLTSVPRALAIPDHAPPKAVSTIGWAHMRDTKQRTIVVEATDRCHRVCDRLFLADTVIAGTVGDAESFVIGGDKTRSKRVPRTTDIVR